MHAVDAERDTRVPAGSKQAERRKCFPELRNKMRHAENRKRRGSKRHQIATEKNSAAAHEPRTPMDGRTPGHLPGTADPRRPDCDRLARAARCRAQARR